jgi:hypothetical protein
MYYYVVFVVMVVVCSCHRPFILCTSPLEPPLRLRGSDCSTFGIACHAPSTTVIFSELLLLCYCYNNNNNNNYYYYYYYYYIDFPFLLHPRHVSKNTDFLSLPPGCSSQSPYHAGEERTIFCPKLTGTSGDQNHRRPNHRGNSIHLYPDSYQYLSPPNR